ncbi:MAG: hypothetical protein KJ971_04265 [Firmicutes bacterium]|nr:hypothetical protein [Bacillota bacterium]
MKQKALIFSVISLVLALVSFVIIGISYGWIVQQTTLPSGEIGVGDLRYEKAGEFIAQDSIIVPSQELISTAFELTNNSPITSQMRMQIIYTKVTTSANDVVYSNAVDDHLTVLMNANFLYSSEYWYYTALDYVISAESGAISILTSMYYDGEFVGIDYSGVPLSVTVTIEVKQADNVSWVELTNYNFSTGYSNP